MPTGDDLVSNASADLFATIQTQAGTRVPEHLPPQTSRMAKLRGVFRKNRGLLTKPATWKLVLRLVGWRVRSLFRSPDIARADHQIIIACHHKVMTTYFTAVLSPLCWALRLRLAKINFGKPPADADVCLSMQTGFDIEQLQQFRGVHVLRDPRDMIVSGYHYHKWTHENWVHLLDDDGRSYQQKLNEASPFDGLMMEIDHFLYTNGRRLTEWDIEHTSMLEVSFEELMGDDRDGLYRQMFEHLGFSGKELELCIALMRLFEAGSRTGMKKGAVAEKSHIRTASSGQWRSILRKQHGAYIEKYLGPVLRKFGYEKDASWVDQLESD